MLHEFFPPELHSEPYYSNEWDLTSCISVVAMSGAVIGIDDASANDTIRSVKERVFASNRKLHVRRQLLMYRPGPRGMEPLADDETLGGAGVAQDGTAELDVLLLESKPEDVAAINGNVRQSKLNSVSLSRMYSCCSMLSGK